MTSRFSWRLLASLLLASTLVLAGCERHPATKARKPFSPIAGEPVPLGPLPGTVLPRRYRVSLTIDPAADRFSGHDEIDVTFAKPGRAMFLHARDLNVSAASVRLSARRTIPAHFMQIDKSGVARLIFVDEVPKGRATLVFDYDAAYSAGMDGLYKVVADGKPYVFTQFEAISARAAFPSLDEPRFKTPFLIDVTAPAADKVISNAPVAHMLNAGAGITRTVFEPTRPLPTYLVAVSVGDFDIVDAGEIPANSVRSHPIRLRGITSAGNGARIKYALSQTPKLVTALEKYFGIAYPFQKLDLVAVPDFAAGAMENAGAINYRERWMLLDENAPLDQRRASLAIQAHELTHQWFGDLVTPAWWDDVWLNESFATWMEYKIALEVMPHAGFGQETLAGAFDAMRIDELPSARQIRQPVKGPDDIVSAFDAITYDKGAAVLSMFESYTGKQRFQHAIHAYLRRHAWNAATAQDFISAVAETAGANAAESNALKQSFDSFIEQPGVPNIRMAILCGKAGAASEVSQSPYAPLGFTPPKRIWNVPICLTPQGKGETCLILGGSSADVPLGQTCPAAVMPNAQGQGYYRFALDPAGWRGVIGIAPHMGARAETVVVQNMDAQLSAGSLAASDLLSAIKAFAPTATADGIAAITDVLHRLRLSVLSQNDLPAYRTFVQKAFEGRLTATGLTPRPREAAQVMLLRERLVSLLASEGRMPSLLAQLSKAAPDFLEPGSKPRQAIELRADAFRAGMIVLGPAFGDRLLDAFKSARDEDLRRDIVYAIAGSDDPHPIEKLLALATTQTVRRGELRYVFGLLPDEPVARDAIWRWYVKNFDALSRRVTLRGMARTVMVANTACTSGVRGELDNLIRPKLAQMTGAARSLALTDEAITRCTAFRAAKGTEVAAAFANSK